MLIDFKTHITKTLSFINKSKLIIAVSGGIDSVVLSHLCKALGLNFVLAHCNFNLRGAASNADEKFVLNLAENLKVEAFIQNFDTEAFAIKNKRSIQMAARDLRYQWFNELATQLQYDYILTAHHADDNLETFLINFTRGTGLNGLTGIPTINENIVRPLLPFSRVIIEAYAKKNNIKWREDLSNSSKKYLRNKLRHDVVPILKEINPNLLYSFQDTISNLNDTADIVKESLKAVRKRAIFESNSNDVSYKISEFKKVNNPKAYLFEMFKSFGFTEWNDVLNLLEAQSGKQVFSSSHRLIKHREYLILSKMKHSKDNETPLIINADDASLDTPIGELNFKTVKAIGDNNTQIIYCDKDTLVYPLELRPWKAGDRFQPIGMPGKKKVSKYLKDEKLSVIEKENTWVLTSKNDIVWVAGKRADDRFKLSKKTKQILKIEIILI